MSKPVRSSRRRGAAHARLDRAGRPPPRYPGLAVTRLLFCACLLCGSLAAQDAPRGLPTRSAAADYPAHARAGNLAIGAEYMVRSFSGRGHTFATGDYLVIEVALFPPRGETVEVSSGAFSLRINGKKRALLAQSPGMVAASLKYPDWDEPRRLEVGGGLGDAGVIYGRPEPVERFPGDPRARNPLPRPPRAPDPPNPSGIERRPPPAADEIAVESALAEGPTRAAVAGYLYFPFRGKTRSIKSLHLLYAGPEGEAVLPLLTPRP